MSGPKGNVKYRTERDTTFLALKMEEGTMTEGIGVASES